MVAQQMPLILEIQTDAWWENVTLPMLETVRKSLRDLVKFIDKAQRTIIYSDFEDQIGPGVEVKIGQITAAVNRVAYRKKMLQFIHAHESHTSIHKLRTGEPLTQLDLDALDQLLFGAGAGADGLGTREQFEAVFGPQEHLGLFICHLVGLDREAAKAKFNEYLSGSRFNGAQIRLINYIVEYLTKNGVMEPERLYEPPCTDMTPNGIDGLFDDADATRILSILQQIERAAIPATPQARTA